ncbi:hypothetical protein [Kineococcus sp. SYSU DK002]|uniref:hypothetical protein n=1 Tax=Kineococcus sp. SYSU DK002 TaxID=3383123 RepID=UPI003D7D7BED
MLRARGRSWTGAAAVLAATVGQLLVATFASDLPQFEGKAFGARLVSYPLLMLFVPVVWFAVHRGSRPAPWAGFTLVMLPFLVDVSGNTLDLYDTVVWWDDLLHFLNWCLLTLGLGLVLRVADVRPRWARAVATVGGGALLALLWEIGEWWTFIRHGTELGTAYEDTLGDMVLGTTGSAVALAVLVLLRRRVSRRGSPGTRP